jgi:hypothetical protein
MLRELTPEEAKKATEAKEFYKGFHKKDEDDDDEEVFTFE